MKLNDSCDMDTLAAMLRFNELITQVALNGWQIFILAGQQSHVIPSLHFFHFHHCSLVFTF